MKGGVELRVFKSFDSQIVHLEPVRTQRRKELNKCWIVLLQHTRTLKYTSMVGFHKPLRKEEGHDYDCSGMAELHDNR